MLPGRLGGSQTRILAMKRQRVRDDERRSVKAQEATGTQRRRWGGRGGEVKGLRLKGVPRWTKGSSRPTQYRGAASRRYL